MPQGLTYDKMRQQAIEIAEINARMALDQVGAYESREAAVAAYLVNVFDTFREQDVRYGREAAVEAFLAIVNETE